MVTFGDMDIIGGLAASTPAERPDGVRVWTRATLAGAQRVYQGLVSKGYSPNKPRLVEGPEPWEVRIPDDLPGHVLGWRPRDQAPPLGFDLKPRDFAKSSPYGFDKRLCQGR